ncbi:MAG: hypothetical protein AAF551_06535 [Bacteroidota bacterium]
MKKLFVFVLGVVTIFVAPSCSTTDGLDEVIQNSDLDVTAIHPDEEDKIAHPR